MRNGCALLCLGHGMITYLNQSLHHKIKCIGFIVMKHQLGLLLTVRFCRANLLGPAGKITVHDIVMSLAIKYKKKIL